MVQRAKPITMITSVPTATYKTRLEARLKVLEREHKIDVDKHRRAKAQWDKDIRKWVQHQIQLGRLEQLEYHADRGTWCKAERVGFKPEDFFRGCPPQPAPPQDKRLRRIRTLIQQLALTEAKSVKVMSEEIEELFSENTTESDD